MGDRLPFQIPEEQRGSVQKYVFQQEKETAPTGNKNDCKSCQISHAIPRSFNPFAAPARKERELQTAGCQPPRLMPVAVVLIHW